MRVKCDYCRSFIDETEEFCPYCQAPNDKLKRMQQESQVQFKN